MTASMLIVIVFVFGYLGIALEHKLNINKAAIALFIGVVCWCIYVTNVESLLLTDSIPEWFQTEAFMQDVDDVPLQFAIEAQHLHQTGEIASVLFFLLGAMTIVELVDSHEGFSFITARIKTRDKRKLLWIVGIVSFAMSAALDNLTATIVMVSLLRKLVDTREDRLKYVGLTVIATNAGGAWTVIGDVTTTMLWIKHRIDATQVMAELIWPSLICLIVPLIGMSFTMKGTLDAKSEPVDPIANHAFDASHRLKYLILGLAGMLSVPLFKYWTHLPPYMGMMLALSVLWIVSEIDGRDYDEKTRSSSGVLAALRRVDLTTVLFFLGILLAVGALSASGMLASFASVLDTLFTNNAWVAVTIGLLSSVVDNVPLVAAGIDMYDLPSNDYFWMMLAYCAGTGGSCLIIGSAAGVAAMGMERINFVWYLKHITPWALAGYLSGAMFLLVF